VKPVVRQWPFIRPHRLGALLGCGLLRQMSHVAWSACLCVGRAKTAEPTAEPTVVLFGADSCGPKEPCITRGRDPPREGAVLGVHL